MNQTERMVLEICQEIGIEVERGFTIWQRWGFRLKSSRSHFAPMEKFWCRNHIIKAIHERVCEKKPEVKDEKDRT